MENLIDRSAISTRVVRRSAQPQQLRRGALEEESLPFTIRLVHSEQDLRKALEIRQEAYARHLPDFARTLESAEPEDGADGVVILLAESKLDGTPIGTMRIQTNRFKPLSLERSIDLPDWLTARSLAEATRLGVTAHRVGHLVKTALFKTYFFYCIQRDVEWMVIAGRAPIDRQYERLMFNDVYPELGYVPLRHAGNMPHRIMSIEVQSVEARWKEAKHPLAKFFFDIHHPDIDLREIPVPVFQ